jgi:hypothetical protein
MADLQALLCPLSRFATGHRAPGSEAVMKNLIALVSVLTAGGLIAVYSTGHLPDSWAEPLVATPDLAIVNGSGTRPGEARQVNFTLTNRGDRPVTITGVIHCCGKGPLADLRSSTLRPGESCELPVQFPIPEAGVRREKLEVEYDGSRVPVELNAEVIGSRELPYVVEGGRQQVAFFDLRSAGMSQTLRLTTCEGAGPPWLGTVSCDLPGVVIERVDLREQPTGPVFTRTYEFRIGWSKLPEGREFFGKLRAKTAYGAASGLPPEVEIGTVAGTRAADDDFAPKVARLDAAGGWSDVIVFRQPPGTGDWQFRPGWTAPDWLACEWDRQADRQLLRVALRNAASARTPDHVMIPLTSGGRSAELPVEIVRR